MPTEARGIGYEIFKNVVIALLTLYKLEKRGFTPTVSDFLKEADLSRSVFFNHLKRNLEHAGWVTFKVNPDRTITMHLTPKGKKVAQTLATIENELKEAGIL